MNQVQLAGRIGTDIDYKQLNGKTSVAEFRLATGYGDHTEWHSVKAWGKAADKVNKFFEKGSFIIIPSGQIKTESWEKDGQKRSKVVINCNFVEFGPKQQSEDDDLGI